MTILSFFTRASRAFNGHPSASKLLVLCTIREMERSNIGKQNASRLMQQIKMFPCGLILTKTLVGNKDFSLEYDYLIIALGAQVNTFNTPGVKENSHFLKASPIACAGRTCFCAGRTYSWKL
ncbi:hypothetical protein C1H46_042026 [Malus baccata]|uniref:FAD/NAD(P)-binding domain-containing protein n=1 Tax=Malus baccata TaxID=106549 RepID=A0A540KDY9_MALBA|nr:hypothetical protein C1H46_042026 [Malus baccata]